MTIPISLIALRDILTNYASSAAFNAARAFEARQPYAELDADVPSRILPAALGREIAGHDPTEQVFHVQIKRIPEDFVWLGEAEDSRDKWSASEYAVVHAIADWKGCFELRYQAQLARRHVELFNASTIAEEARRDRMIRMICKRIPIPPATVRAVFALCTDETTLREMVAQWEKALHTTIYELPAPSPERNQSLPEDAAEADQGNGQAASGREGAGDQGRSLDGDPHQAEDRSDAAPEGALSGAGCADHAAGDTVPEARPCDDSSAGGR